MPNFKVVFQFTQPNKGWTEVYYRTATDLGSAANFPSQLLFYMMGARDSSTTLVKARVSDVLNNRLSIPVNIGLAGQQGIGGPEPAGVSALVNLVSTQFPSSRKLWLRGIPDSYMGRNVLTGTPNPSGILLQAINSMINQLSTNGFTIRSLVKLGPPPNNYTNILSVGVVQNAGQVTLNTIAGPVLNPGTLIIVNQVSQKQFPGLKGVFSVISSTASTVVIPYNGTVTEIVTLQKGRFRLVNYNYGAIQNTGSGFLDFTTRSTGRNPLGGRGARRGVRGIRSA